MSVFPAYSANIQNSEGTADTTNKTGAVDQTWLENSSFDQTLCLQNEPVKRQVSQIQEADSSVTEKKISSVSQSKNKKIQHNAQKEKLLYLECDDFSIVEKGCREFLKVNTIAWPSAPKYSVSYKLGNRFKKIKNQKLNRYYKMLIDVTSKDDTVNKEKADSEVKDENFTGFVQEVEFTQKTAIYNQHLTQYPCDVKMWLEYVQFQDLVHQFEKIHRKGSMAKAQRVLAERKLSILEKALSYNSNCELLHRERLNIAVRTFPADELQMFLNSMVEKNKGNIILWQGYIEATQCSMSHCNTPAVLNLYIKCLSTLHLLRRVTALEKHLLEESILRMLYQCGLFLKQAGLFEQLWTLLRMYLELNLCPIEKNKFNISNGFNEKQLIELEEVIFTSQLPLHELWLRTEKLRESCHWLPYVGDNNCEDPQRLVFPEDVAELIHPITTPENIFKLTATIFSLLKIPLLPCRHTTMQDLGLDYVPWSLDSVESLLPIFLPSFPVVVIDEHFLKNHKLAVGPQYLKSMPGQDEYLKFVLNLMKSCSECLSENDKLAVTIWWFRFQRLLILLDNIKYIKLSDKTRKQIKKDCKDMLKLAENRQNVLYYLEYALLENELGNIETCVNIINVASKMCDNVPFQSEERTLNQSISCFLCRQQVQLMLKNELTCSLREKVLLYLSEFVLQRKLHVLSAREIKEAGGKFKELSTIIIAQGIKHVPSCSNFIPDFLTEWIMCNGWFIYLNEGIHTCAQFVKEVLNTLNENNKNPCLQKEILYEFYVAILFKHTSEETTGNVFKLLDNILYQAIEIYPNNLFLLSVLAKKQSLIHSFGPPWWKVQNLLLKSERALCTIFAIIILNQHINTFQETLVDTVTGK